MSTTRFGSTVKVLTDEEIFNHDRFRELVSRYSVRVHLFYRETDEEKIPSVHKNYYDLDPNTCYFCGFSIVCRSLEPSECHFMTDLDLHLVNVKVLGEKLVELKFQTKVFKGPNEF